MTEADALDAAECRARAENARLAERVRELEAKEAAMREAIEYYFTPGPGCAMPEWHEDPREPHQQTWNRKLDKLKAALASNAGKLLTASEARIHDLEAELRDTRVSLINSGSYRDDAEARVLILEAERDAAQAKEAVMRQTLSESVSIIRDIARRIGVTATVDWVRGELSLVASRMESHSASNAGQPLLDRLKAAEAVCEVAISWAWGSDAKVNHDCLFDAALTAWCEKTHRLVRKNTNL